MSDGNNFLNKNFLRLALKIDEIASKELPEAETLKMLNDALTATLEIFNASFIVGKDVGKVNVVKSFWEVLKNVVNNMVIEKEEKENGNNNKKDKKDKKSK